MKRLIPSFAFGRVDGTLYLMNPGEKPVTIGTYRVVGEMDGMDSFGGAQVMELLVVTLTGGREVPAYRYQKAEGNASVCQMGGTVKDLARFAR